MRAMEEKRNVVLEEQIRKLLQQPVEADYHAIQMTLKNGAEISPMLQKRIDQVDKLHSATEALLSVLNENEEMVIRRHVIDGLDWACVGAEFGQTWGMENQKSKRSLINYYNTACRKMADYVEQNKEIFDFSWLYRL